MSTSHDTTTSAPGRLRRSLLRRLRQVAPSDREPPLTLEASPRRQTHCPVSGMPTDERYFADYGGERIYFCCAYCRGLFLERPREYTEAVRKAAGTA